MPAAPRSSAAPADPGRCQRPEPFPPQDPRHTANRYGASGEVGANRQHPCLAAGRAGRRVGKVGPAAPPGGGDAPLPLIGARRSGWFETAEDARLPWPRSLCCTTHAVPSARTGDPIQAPRPLGHRNSASTIRVFTSPSRGSSSRPSPCRSPLGRSTPFRIIRRTPAAWRSAKDARAITSAAKPQLRPGAERIPLAGQVHEHVVRHHVHGRAACMLLVERHAPHKSQVCHRSWAAGRRRLGATKAVSRASRLSAQNRLICAA